MRRMSLYGLSVVALCVLVGLSSCASSPRGGVDTYSSHMLARTELLSPGSMSIISEDPATRAVEPGLLGLVEGGLRAAGLSLALPGEESEWRVDLLIRARSYLFDLSNYTSLSCRMSVVEISSGRVIGSAEIVEDTKYPIESLSYLRDLVGRTARALAAAVFSKK